LEFSGVFHDKNILYSTWEKLFLNSNFRFRRTEY